LFLLCAWPKTLATTQIKIVGNNLLSRALQGRLEFISNERAVSEKRFPSPVRVKSPSNSFIVSTAWEAVEYLKRWPAKRGREYRIALQHCLDATDGLRSPRAAQVSFAMAARTAGLLV
jgi:hypothetical protein